MMYLVRHATAGVRDHSDPDDFSRPLDHHGRNQAQWIANRLADADVATVISSEALRCQQTVAPTAANHNVAVRTEPALSEGSSLAAAVDAVRSAGDHSVICLHGDLLPEVVRVLRNAGMQTEGPASFAKGIVWSIELDDNGRPGHAFCELAPGELTTDAATPAIDEVLQ